MPIRRAIGTLTALALVTIFAAAAQTVETGENARVDIPPPLPASMQDGTTSDPLNIDVPCDGVTDDAAKSSCWKALKQRFDYFTFGMEHRMRVFQWQHTSSRVIFVFVLLLVSVGLLFSYMQFRMYLRGAGRTRSGTGQPSGKSMETDLEISSGGVKASSNVLGVIILTLSLAFFYLYLVHVFPVSDTF